MVEFAWTKFTAVGGKKTKTMYLLVPEEIRKDKRFPFTGKEKNVLMKIEDLNGKPRLVVENEA